MKEIEKVLISQLINCGYLQYENIANNKIALSGNISCDISHNTFGEIVVEHIKSDKTLFEILLNVFDENVATQLVNDLLHSYEYMNEFDMNVNKLFDKNGLSIGKVLIANNDDFYNFLCRLIDREAEYNHYVFMFRNKIPKEYRVDNSFSLMIPFVKNTLKIAQKDFQWYNYFENGIPVHPSNSLINNYDIEHYEPLNFSASHRTFTSEKFPFYIKLDVPYTISSTLRLLTNNERRLKASRLAVENLSKFKSNFSKKLHILYDSNYICLDSINIMIRKKYEHLRFFPLFALLKNFPNQDLTMFDVLFNSSSKVDPLDFSLTEIVYPIMDVLKYFVEISKDEFIQPSNFHRQNINIVIENNMITGIAVQDIDMANKLEDIYFFAEYDTYFSKCFLEPLANFLSQKYGVEKKQFIYSINKYYCELFESYNFLNNSKYKNRCCFWNCIDKDLKNFRNITHRMIYHAKANPYR